MKKYQLYYHYQDEQPQIMIECQFDFFDEAKTKADEFAKNSVCYGTVYVVSDNEIVYTGKYR